MELRIKGSVIKKYLRTILVNGEQDMLVESLELLKDHLGAHFTLVVDGKIFYTTVKNADHLLYLKKQVRKGISDYIQYTSYMKLYRLKYGTEFAILLVEYEHPITLGEDLVELVTLISRIATYRDHILTSYLTDKFTKLPNRDAVLETCKKGEYSTLAYIKVCNRKELVANAGLEYFDKMVQGASELLVRNQACAFRTSVDSFAYLLQSDTSSSFLFMQDVLEQVEDETELEVSACITPIGGDIHFALYLCESYPFTVPKDICILREIKE